jgi:hypothetical protein
MSKNLKENFFIDANIDQNPFVHGMAIVCCSTGIYCRIQVGGKKCIQRSVEGYRVPIWINPDKIDEFQRKLKEFDDCNWGCYGKDQNGWTEERQKQYAIAIDDELLGFVNLNNLENHAFYFDYNRLDELMEGWWPVTIYLKGEEDSIKAMNTYKAYLHFGNCD